MIDITTATAEEIQAEAARIIDAQARSHDSLCIVRRSACETRECGQCGMERGCTVTPCCDCAAEDRMFRR